MKGKTCLISTLKKKIKSRMRLFWMSDRRFLELAYREILGRELDEEGLKFFTNLLSLGFSRWEIILSLIRSEEFIKKTKREHSELVSDQIFLEKVYRLLFGREIEEEGLQRYSQLFQRGEDRFTVLSILLRSSEFINKVLSDNLPLKDIRHLKSERYRMAEDFVRQQQIPVFRACLKEDFDWLERLIQEMGYYERPGIWSYDVDLDKKVIAEILAYFVPQKILEIGCSNGAVLKGLNQMGFYGEGVEISAMAYSRAFPEIKDRIYRGDLLEIELPSGYDLIYGLDIFEHFNPNKLGAYVRKISDKMAEGGYLYCNIPAFGDDPVFGRLFPLFVKEWEDEGRNHHPFQTLPVDEWGYPLHGHLIWADTTWWISQFESTGLKREVEIEKALHLKYDAYLEARAIARKSFYVFSRQGHQKKSRTIIKAILNSHCPALSGLQKPFRGK